MRTALPFAAFAVLAACGVEPAPGETAQAPQSLQKAARPSLEAARVDRFHWEWQRPAAPPGCAGAPTLEYGTAAAGGNVTLSNADILNVSAAISGGQVDLRVQFCDMPFPTTATHQIGWCLDTDASSADGACGVGSNSDNAVSVSRGAYGFYVQVGVGPSTHLLSNPCDAVKYDPATKVLRVAFPASELPGVGHFNYDVGSSFGGSGGANDWAPSGQFGPMLGVASTSPLPQFDGVSICTLRP